MRYPDWRGLLCSMDRSPLSTGDEASASIGELMTAIRRLVSVVDDDESIRGSLPDLLKELGFAVRAFSSAEDFLASDCVQQTDCLVLDVAMPGMSGPELQLQLTHRQIQIPIVFITANREESTRSQVLERGAAACLLKPFSEAELIGALGAALDAG
jgi:FixJ family two-component response regulator